MSMNVHLIVRYRQLCNDFPNYTQHELVYNTTTKMVWPCLYTALTTIMAFISLVVSGIKPVIDFGWMMTIGLSVTFLTSFILFPSLLILLPKISEEKISKDLNLKPYSSLDKKEKARLRNIGGYWETIDSLENAFKGHFESLIISHVDFFNSQDPLLNGQSSGFC